jgi:hypothetical protein
MVEDRCPPREGLARAKFAIAVRIALVTFNLARSARDHRHTAQSCCIHPILFVSASSGTSWTWSSVGSTRNWRVPVKFDERCAPDAQAAGGGEDPAAACRPPTSGQHTATTATAATSSGTRIPTPDGLRTIR